MLFLSSCACADTTQSLADFLRRANAEGHQILFSSALVRPYYKVTSDPDLPISLEQVRTALRSYQLDLQAGFDKSYLVVPATESTQPPTPLASGVSVTAIEEIVVNASAHSFQLAHIGSSLSFDRENLAKRPVIANDVLRVASRLPGAANNGVSGRSSIRGGRDNETLITFNGMRLYDPYHLHQFNQLFSVVDGRSIDSLDFLTGGFPAIYGDRLSGVTVINTIAPGEADDFRELGLGLYTASWFQTKSVAPHHFVVTARRSTIDAVLGGLESDLGKPSFADLHAQYQYDINDHSNISANLLWFGDDLSINNSSGTESADSSFGNTYAWLSYKNEIDERLTTDTRLSFTAIKDDRRGTVDKPGMVSGSLSDDQEFRVYSLEHTRQYLFDENLFNLGATYRYLKAEYGFQSELHVDPRFTNIANFDRPVLRQFAETETGQQLAAHVSYKRRIFEPLYIEAGLRIDAQDYLGRSWSTELTPRLNLLYLLPFGGELRLGLGKFSQAQGIHELDASDGISAFQKPQKAQHYVVSYSQSFAHMDFRIEAYRKRTTDPGYYFENLADPISLIPELQIDRTRVEPELVVAAGIELSISGEWRDNEFWMNYTRAEVEEHQEGQRVRRSSDQKHAATLGWSRQLGRWSLAVESTYHTGWPTSSLSLDATGSTIPVIRNDRRLPHYVTLDLKGTRQWQWQQSAFRLEAGLTNLMDRDNIIGTEYQLVNNSLLLSETRALPIAPFIDLFYSF